MVKPAATYESQRQEVYRHVFQQAECVLQRPAKLLSSETRPFTPILQARERIVLPQVAVSLRCGGRGLLGGKRAQGCTYKGR